MSTPVTSAKDFSIDVYDVSIKVDEAGNARVKLMVLFDSTNVTALRLPVYLPADLRVYDLGGNLEYFTINSTVIIKARERTKDYSLTAEYTTNQLTSKSGNEWNVSYTVFVYDPIKDLSVALGLPSGSSLEHFTPDGRVSVEETFMKIEWYLHDLGTDERSDINVRYTMQPPAHRDAGVFNNLIYILLALVLFVPSLILYRRYSKTHAKDATAEESPKIDIAHPGIEPGISEGKKDVMTTLNKNERDIVMELLKSESKLTQRDIFTKTGIPKSTLSRTLKSLERKNIIEIKDIGFTNLVMLTEWFREK